MLLNYTTKIDADKTAQEISKCLSLHGAKAVLTEYDEATQSVKAISFMISMGDQEIKFRLPCDAEPVYQILAKESKTKNWDSRYEKIHAELRMQAVRTAWRIVKDWVEAQMALVETKMVSTAQVFLPYAVTRSGLTLSEQIAQKPELLLGDGQ